MTQSPVQPSLRLPSCRETQHQLRLACRGDLEPSPEFREHLRQCSTCRDYRGRLAKSLSALAVAREAAVPNESGTYSQAAASQWPSVRRRLLAGRAPRPNVGDDRQVSAIGLVGSMLVAALLGAAALWLLPNVGTAPAAGDRPIEAGMLPSVVIESLEEDGHPTQPARRTRDAD